MAANARRLLGAGLVSSGVQFRDKIALGDELADNVDKRLHIVLVPQERPVGIRYRLRDVTGQCALRCFESLSCSL